MCSIIEAPVVKHRYLEQSSYPAGNGKLSSPNCSNYVLKSYL